MEKDNESLAFDSAFALCRIIMKRKAKQNIWRFSLHQFNDLQQEYALIFMKCWKLYNMHPKKIFLRFFNTSIHMRTNQLLIRKYQKFNHQEFSDKNTVSDRTITNYDVDKFIASAPPVIANICKKAIETKYKFGITEYNKVKEYILGK